MKKVLKFSVALFLIGALLSSVSYALGGRVPDSLTSRLENGIRFGIGHIENRCNDNGMGFPDRNRWDEKWS